VRGRGLGAGSVCVCNALLSDLAPCMMMLFCMMMFLMMLSDVAPCMSCWSVCVGGRPLLHGQCELQTEGLEASGAGLGGMMVPVLADMYEAAWGACLGGYARGCLKVHVLAVMHAVQVLCLDHCYKPGAAGRVVPGSWWAGRCTPNAVMSLGVSAAASLGNWLFIEPKTTGLMFERYAIENKVRLAQVSASAWCGWVTTL